MKGYFYFTLVRDWPIDARQPFMHFLWNWSGKMVFDEVVGTSMCMGATSVVFGKISIVGDPLLSNELTALSTFLIFFPSSLRV